MDAILVVGIATIAGLIFGKIVSRFKVPIVAGYVIAGVLLGKSVLGIMGDNILENSSQPQSSAVLY